MNFFRNLFPRKYHRKVVLRNSSGLEVTVDISSTNEEAISVIVNRLGISKPKTSPYDLSGVWAEFDKIMSELNKYK
jgi:hypothetical protein